jgi:hypothetical protein
VLEAKYGNEQRGVCSEQPLYFLWRKMRKINYNAHWRRDYENYPYSNWLADRGLKPYRRLDWDGDGVVNWEDCNPKNKYKQASKKSSTKKSGTTANNLNNKNTGKKGTAVYNPDMKGVITSDGRFYPTSNKNWLPTGYSQGQGMSSKEGYWVEPIPKKDNTKTSGNMSSMTNITPSADSKEIKEANANQTIQKTIENTKTTKKTLGQRIEETSDKIPIPYVRKIPTVVYKTGESVIKGGVKTGLYAIDEAGYITKIKKNEITGQLYIPEGTKAISDRWGKTTEWADYDFKRNPITDKDYQNLALGAGLIGVSSIGPTAAKIAYGSIMGYQSYQTYKDPSEENIAGTGLMAMPYGVKIARKVKARGDVLVADTGELVPLKERITQVDKAINNAGKEIEMVTAKPSKKAKFTNVKDVNNPDYTYGNNIEFGTYKVGEAYPTSKYFIEGKATKLQKIMKRGRVNIEKVEVAETNLKYGNKIKSDLLKDGETSESTIRDYYNEAKIEANAKNRPVAVISPKRLRGISQAEQELVKMLPDNYKPKRLKFSGWTETGHRVYTDQNLINRARGFIGSKINKSRIEKSYWDEIAREKQEYLAGRPAIRGEYKGHGMKHLKPMEKWNPLYKEHDIMKVGDVDSFSKFPHGETAMKWAKRKGISKKMAEAYGGHEYARFNLKTLFIKPNKKGLKSLTIPSFKQMKWTLRNSNTYLQDVATLDRLDLVRFGHKVDRRFLSENALKRLFGSEKNIKSSLTKLNKKADIIRKQLEKEGKYKEETGYEKYGRYKGKGYNKPYFTYEYKSGYKTPYQTNYQVPYEIVYPTKYSNNYRGKYKTPYKGRYDKPYKGSYKGSYETPYSEPPYSPSYPTEIKDTTTNIPPRKRYKKSEHGNRMYIKGRWQPQNIYRYQDPYMRMTGKAKYSVNVNKLLRARYGTAYS